MSQTSCSTQVGPTSPPSTSLELSSGWYDYSDLYLDFTKVCHTDETQQVAQLNVHNHTTYTNLPEISD